MSRRHIEAVIEEPVRLDKVVATFFKIPRSAARNAILSGNLKVSGREVRKPSEMFHGSIEMELIEDEMPAGPIMERLYEDEVLIAVNKPPGLIVHRVGQRIEPTVVDTLLNEGVGLVGGHKLRSGVVHRLDRPTSGVLLLTKDKQAHADISAQFREHRIEKVYLAIVSGVPKTEEGIIDAPLARGSHPLKRLVRNVPEAKESKTYFKILEKFQDYAYLEIHPTTGRTHQIRSHLAAIGVPIIGDKLYFAKDKTKATISAERAMLHAVSLSIAHPVSKEKITITSSLPNDFESILAQLRKREQNNDLR
jgi:23S rRNA pseudouridine1911/1915/1917 synthase